MRFSTPQKLYVNDTDASRASAITFNTNTSATNNNAHAPTTALVTINTILAKK